MDAGQIIMVPAAPATNAMPAAAMNGIAAQLASQDTAFGNLLGQTMAALENTNGMSVIVSPGGATGTSKAAPSVAEEKIQLEDGDAVKEQNFDGDLTAAAQVSALLAEIAAMQTTVEVKSEPLTNAENVTQAVSAGAVMSVGVSGTEIDTLQEDVLAGVEKNKVVAELSAPVVKTEAAPAKTEAAPAKTEAAPAKTEAAPAKTEAAPVKTEAAPVKTEAAPVKTEAAPVKTEAAPVKNPSQRNTATVSVAVNSQQAVSALVQQSNATSQAAVVAVSVPTNASNQAMQVAQESQAVLTEVAVMTKPAETSPVATAVRFAQSSDVVAATNDARAQGDTSSQLAQQDGKGGAPFTAATKTVAIQLESGLEEHQTEPILQGRPVEHQLLASSLGQQVATTVQAVSVEQLKPMQAEQVTRQVAERLINHDIKIGSDQISLKLSPENLGNLQLNMRMEDQHLKLEIVAENRGVRDALLLQKDELKETLARQNIQMDSFTVTTGNGGNNQQQSRDWRQMTADQRQYQPQNASTQNRGYSGIFDAPMQYFAPQYNSTIDVRF
jgi:flagellar hook-length control protein FliK